MPTAGWVAAEPSCPNAAALLQFTGWLHSSGAYLSPKLSLYCNSVSRGVRVVKPLESGEVAAWIPLSLLMTNEAAAEDETLKAVSTGTNLIALFLLRQREADSAWQPYVSALPKEIGTTLFWSEEELAELQSSELAGLARSRADAVSRHHAALTASTATTSSFFSEDDFRWALSIVWSRGHTVQLPGVGRQGALVPLIDMFNHHARPGLDAARVEGNAFVLRTTRRHLPGEEATVPYGAQGPLPNSRLLMEYGFCNETNDASDYLTLTLNASHAIAPQADPHRYLRAAVFSNLELLPQEAHPLRIRLQARRAVAVQRSCAAPLPCGATFLGRAAAPCPTLTRGPRCRTRPSRLSRWRSRASPRRTTRKHSKRRWARPRRTRNCGSSGWERYSITPRPTFRRCAF